MRKAKRTEWKGTLPVVSSRAGAAHYREEDDEGSVWLVTLDAAGQYMERALVSPGPEPKAKLEAAARVLAEVKSAMGNRSKRLEALRDKRRKKTALTPKEKQELLDLLAGI